MVDTALSVIPTLVNLGIKVYDAVQTQQDNNDECKNLANVLKLVNHQLEFLQQIKPDQRQSLEQELERLKEHLEECEKFIDKHGQEWTLKKIVFHQSEKDELKKLNTKLMQWLALLHSAMTATFGNDFRKQIDKFISNQSTDRGLLVEILKLLKVSPSDKTMFDRG